MHLLLFAPADPRRDPQGKHSQDSMGLGDAKPLGLGTPSPPTHVIIFVKFLKFFCVPPGALAALGLSEPCSRRGRLASALLLLTSCCCRLHDASLLYCCCCSAAAAVAAPLLLLLLLCCCCSSAAARVWFSLLHHPHTPTAVRLGVSTRVCVCVVPRLRALACLPSHVAISVCLTTSLLHACLLHVNSREWRGGSRIRKPRETRDARGFKHARASGALTETAVWRLKDLKPPLAAQEDGDTPHVGDTHDG